MDLELAGKVAVVTGANKGIGLAITHALVAEGASMVAGSLSTENLAGLDRVTAVPVDLMAEDGPALLVQQAVDEHGRLDVLVNNVGAVRIRVGGFLATSDEELEWSLRMNFFTGLRATRAAQQWSIRVRDPSSTSPRSTLSSNPAPPPSTTGWPRSRS